MERPLPESTPVGHPEPPVGTMDVSNFSWAVPEGRTCHIVRQAPGRPAGFVCVVKGNSDRLRNLENVRRMEMDQSAARGRLLQVRNQNHHFDSNHHVDSNHHLTRPIILQAPSFWIDK
ncbi:hypothetical protein L917_13030, partial [Phytophthora nicotianae]